MTKIVFNVVLALISVVGLFVIVHHLPDDWGWWSLPVAVLIGYVGGYLIGAALMNNVREPND